uniref:Uncharacterized protein n=1 Tax=Plectus sambesii TaxID=2011161 RepID=A0A914WL14_9BILA
LGRELGEYGLEAYTEVKTVTIKRTRRVAAGKLGFFNNVVINVRVHNTPPDERSGAARAQLQLRSTPTAAVATQLSTLCKPPYSVPDRPPLDPRDDPKAAATAKGVGPGQCAVGLLLRPACMDGQMGDAIWLIVTKQARTQCAQLAGRANIWRPGMAYAELHLVMEVWGRHLLRQNCWLTGRQVVDDRSTSRRHGQQPQPS